MKWSDHRRITEYVCKSYGLDFEITKKVVEASILPDIEPDYIWVKGKRRVYKKRVSHHSLEGLRVGLRYLKLARANYVRGLDFTVELGKALHYIQDFCVSPHRRFLIFFWRDYGYHERVENEICGIPIDGKFVKRGFGDKIRPHQFEGIVRENGLKGKPHYALNNAVYLSSVALKLVIDPCVSGDIEKEYSKKLRNHIGLILTVFGGVMLVGLVSGFGLIISGFLGGAFSYAMHKLDIPFWKLKFDRDWLIGKI